MRHLFLGVAACWAAPALAQPAKSALPARVADALAREPLTGKVLVPADVTLQPSLAGARADTAPPRGTAAPRAMKVVRDHGDVVEVSTAQVTDCTEAFGQPYELAVFVRRAKLYPRTKTERVAIYRDGTAVAIDRGAPVALGAAGVAWQAPALAATGVAPNVDALSYAVAHASAQLPPLAGDRLVCDGGEVLTFAEYKAAREAQARREAEARRAEREREAAERERQRREAEAKAPKRKRSRLEADAEGLADLLAGTGTSVDHGGLANTLGPPLYDERTAPYCSVGEPIAPYGRAQVTVAKPTIDGKPVAWPASSGRDHVVAAGPKRYLAEVLHTCGRVRMLVEPAGLHGGGMGGTGTLGGRKQVTLWVPDPGPVTWPDGSPAGIYRGRKRYQDVVEIGGRICVNVRGVAERVCHPKQTTRQILGSPYDAD